jgi:hypothetical protein
LTGTLVSRHALQPDPDGVESSGDRFVHRYLERVRGHWVSGLCEVTTRRAMRRAASSFNLLSQPSELASEQGFWPSSEAKGLLE